MNAQSDPTKFVAKITVLNASTLVTDGQAIWGATVCSKQLRTDFCPMWALPTCEVTFKPDESKADPDSEIVVLLDRSDAAGVEGYHDRATASGNPYAKAFVEHGNWLMTLSHECLEMVLDPFCNTFDLNPETGLYHAREACDACESESYEVDGEYLSDFLLPGFFGLPARHETERTGALLMTFAGTIEKPFDTGRGGYQIVRDPKTDELSQIYGKHRDQSLDEWKKHPAARTATRLAGIRRELRS